jgi:tetratricopeptide (TPR) repeat protein
MKYIAISYLLLLFTNSIYAQDIEKAADNSSSSIKLAKIEYEYALNNEASSYYLQQLAYNIAAMNQNYGNYDEAFIYHEKRLYHILADTSLNYNIKASAYNNLGSVERVRGNFDKSEYYLNMVDLSHPELIDSQRNFIILNYSGLYLENDLPHKAKESIDSVYDAMVEQLKNQELMLTDLRVAKLEIEFVLEPTAPKLSEIENLILKMISLIGEETPFAQRKIKRLEALKEQLRD